MTTSLAAWCEFPPPQPPSLISDCCHSGEVENCHHQLQPPFHVRDTSNATVNVDRFSPMILQLNIRETFSIQLPNFEQTLSVISVEAPQKAATVCKLQMTNRKCVAVQASLTGTTVTGKGANWVFFYLWLLF